MSSKSSKPAPSAAQQKAMSNRLLTMKFMQRSAASAPKSRASLAASAAAQAVAEEEARQREAAAARLREAAGESAPIDAETHWQLSIARPATTTKSNIITVGLSELHEADSDDDEDAPTKPAADDDADSDEEEGSGRMVFGNFKRKTAEEPKVKREGVEGESDYDSDDSGDSDEEEGDRRKTPKNKSKQYNEPSLAGLTSISGGGGMTTRKSPMKCHNCGENGHMAARCPKMACHNCGEKGHRAAECMAPSRKKRKSDQLLTLEDGEGRRKKERR